MTRVTAASRPLEPRPTAPRRRSISGTQCSSASQVVRRSQSGSIAARHTSIPRAAMSDGSCDAIDGLPFDENMRELWSHPVGSGACLGARSTGWGCVARQPSPCLAKLASGSCAVGRLYGVRLARVRQTAPVLVRLLPYWRGRRHTRGMRRSVAVSTHRRCRSRRCRVSATSSDEVGQPPGCHRSTGRGMLIPAGRIEVSARQIGSSSADVRELWDETITAVLQTPY